MQTSAECALFENEPNVIAKGDEERALIARLEETESESAMSEVEQRDACVRLQEIFQDRKTALNHIVETIEQSYEQILQVSYSLQSRGIRYFIYVILIIKN